MDFYILERIAETLTDTSYTLNGNRSEYLHMLAVQHGYLAQKVADEVIKYYSGTNPDYNRVNHTLKENLEAYSGMMAFWLTLDKMYSDLGSGKITISNLSKEDNMYTFHADCIPSFVDAYNEAEDDIVGTSGVTKECILQDIILYWT